MLPTFVVIGAMKSGTTSLHHYLSEHPEIGMSYKKELDFFRCESNFAKGQDWYNTQFPTGYRVLGESSPNYSKCHLFPGAAERMYSMLPNISLIYLVRDPVDRAISHYVHQVSAGREERPIDVAFENLEQNGYILTGAYMLQLHQFLKFYPAERILIIDSADLLKNRTITMARIFEFLGVDNHFHSKNFDNILHEGSSKRHSNFIDKTFSHVVSPKILRVIRKFTSTKIERPSPTDTLRSRILDYYTDEIEQLEQFTGNDFSSWYSTTKGISSTP